MRLELALSAARLAAIALPCWALIRIAVARTSPRRMSPRREALLAAALLYAVVVAVITVVPLHTTTDDATRVNVVPFTSVFACITGSDGPPAAPQYCIENVVGNVLLFIPLGALLPLLSRRRRSAAAVVGAAVLISTSIETAQWAERMIRVGRTVDIDDVLWNAAGAWVGYWLLRRFCGTPLAPHR